MEWAKKRKIIYTLAFAGIIILLAVYPTYKLVHKAPTCFDNKQNGTEAGIDCGGGCSLVCTADVSPPRVVWVKAFPVTGETYDLGAYIENVNKDAGIKNTHYTIKVIGNNGDVLTEKKGLIDLVPSSVSLIFETGVTFSGAANRLEFSIDSVDLTRWTKASVASSVVLTKNQSLINTGTKPRFDAVLVNTDSVDDVANLTIGAVVYDVSRNPVAISRTYVDFIPKSGEKNIFFTWPNKFTGNDGSFITEIVITPRAVFAE